MYLVKYHRAKISKCFNVLCKNRSENIFQYKKKKKNVKSIGNFEKNIQINWRHNIQKYNTSCTFNMAFWLL